MFSLLRNRFGIPGVISVIALVFAMFGGAYAASNNSGGGKAAASAKGKAGPRGPRGKTGPAGPAGPQGPAGGKGDAGSNGANGANGDKGEKGEKGDTGNTGANGKSVVATPITTAGLEGHCEGVGGTRFQVEGSATKEYACNGEDGETGFTEFLPSEKTEKGVWRFLSNGETVQYVPISFSIPLSEADAAGIAVETLGRTASPTPDCPGTAKEPKAEPGFLCVYTSADTFQTTFYGNPNFAYKPVSSGEEEGVISGGTLLLFESISAGEASAGSFAITAP